MVIHPSIPPMGADGVSGLGDCVFTGADGTVPLVVTDAALRGALQVHLGSKPCGLWGFR